MSSQKTLGCCSLIEKTFSRTFYQAVKQSSNQSLIIIFVEKKNMTLNEVQDSIIDDFSLFDDWMDRYQQLIELGKDLPPIDEKKRTDQYLIKGCQSKVWLDADLVDGKVQFSADSDAIITKGIVSLLIKVLTNRTPQEILDADLYFIDKIGLKENLSPTRSNGLVAMVKQMRMFALAFQAKESRG
jgi:cysteine desulfuration protein SufE